MYIENSLYSKAIYCMEELVITYPQNYYLFVLYAELVCTDARKEPRKMLAQYLLARKYAAHAVILNPHSPRALWCLHHICRSCGKSKQDGGVNADLMKVAVDGLKKVYEKSPLKEIMKEIIQ